MLVDFGLGKGFMSQLTSVHHGVVRCCEVLNPMLDILPRVDFPSFH